MEGREARRVGLGRRQLWKKENVMKLRNEGGGIRRARRIEGDEIIRLGG